MHGEAVTAHAFGIADDIAVGVVARREIVEVDAVHCKVDVVKVIVADMQASLLTKAGVVDRTAIVCSLGTSMEFVVFNDRFDTACRDVRLLKIVVRNDIALTADAERRTVEEAVLDKVEAIERHTVPYALNAYDGGGAAAFGESRINHTRIGGILYAERILARVVKDAVLEEQIAAVFGKNTVCHRFFKLRFYGITTSRSFAP